MIAKLIKWITLPFPKEETHLTRYLAYRELGKAKSILPSKFEKAASISGSNHLCEILGIERQYIKELNHPEYDVRRLPFLDASFDICVADQVIEHVESDLNSVFKEVSRILDFGGIFVNATVMTYPIHYGPKDMWRITPEGHQYLFESNGFEVITSGSWGGFQAVQLLALNLARLPVPKCSWHPVRKIAENQSTDWPVVVWAIGKKISK